MVPNHDSALTMIVALVLIFGTVLFMLCWFFGPYVKDTLSEQRRLRKDRQFVNRLYREL